MKYITKSAEKMPCIFCNAIRMPEEESYTVFKGRKSFIILNIYPYNTAHVMIAPYRHVNSFELLSDDELIDLMKLVKIVMKAIDMEYKPHGYNIGVNVGHIAGAGVEEHLHIHVVPRWLGDTNFMPLIAGVKVIPEDLGSTYLRLKSSVEKVLRENIVDY